MCIFCEINRSALVVEGLELGILNGFLYERLEIKAVLSLFDVAELRSYLGVTGGEYRAAVLIRER